MLLRRAAPIRKHCFVNQKLRKNASVKSRTNEKMLLHLAKSMRKCSCAGLPQYENIEMQRQVSVTMGSYWNSVFLYSLHCTVLVPFWALAVSLFLFFLLWFSFFTLTWCQPAFCLLMLSPDGMVTNPWWSLTASQNPSKFMPKTCVMFYCPAQKNPFLTLWSRGGQSYPQRASVYVSFHCN